MDPSKPKTMKPLFFFILSIFYHAIGAQVLTIHNWQELSQHILSHSLAEQLGQRQMDLAELTEKAAVANVFNPRIPMTGSAINNTNLPVNFLPADAFGGPTGTFREITLGQQYITSFTTTPQFDIINVARWQELKSAKVNTALVASDIAVNKKKTLEQANAIYCNILTYQKQERIAARFVEIADSILQIIEKKQQQGIVRLQEVNDAKVNVLQQQNLLRNIQNALASQLRSLSGICQKEVVISEPFSAITLDAKTSSTGDAELKKAQWEWEYSKQSERTAMLEQLPVLAFQSSLAYQNNSNQKWADPNFRWIYSSFIGLKLTWDFPTNATKYTNVRSKKINSEIAAIQLEEEKRNTVIRNQQTEADYLKARADYLSAEQILLLDKDSYFHAKDLFEKDLISLEKFLQAQKKWMASEMDFANATINTFFQQNKISINNAD